MSKSKALIVASRSEGFGRMTVESMFNGSMVIGRNSGGTLEVLKKMGGILYDGSLYELTKAMCAVHEMSDEEYTTMIQRIKVLGTVPFTPYILMWSPL